MSSFHEHIPETSKGRKANAADQTTEEAQEEKPRGGIGALWARMSSPSASREGSAHGGNAFGQRNQSFGDLWKWVTSPAPSREGSQVCRRRRRRYPSPHAALSVSFLLLLPAAWWECFLKGGLVLEG